MLYSVKNILTHDKINEYVSDYEIYSFYIGERIVINKIFNSPLRKDKNPSFGIMESKNSDGHLLYHDFATGDRGNAITFVQNLLGLNTFKETLGRIYDDMVINSNKIPENILKPLREPKKALKKNVAVQRQPFTETDKEYWSQFGITETTLHKFEVNSVKYFFIDDKVCWSYYNDNPIYVYKVYGKIKVYRPLGEKGKKWGGNLTKNYVFGYKQLPDSGDTLIITKSLKDVMCLYELGYTAISPSAEGVLLPIKAVEEIKKRFKHIVVLYDNDEAGKKAAQRMKDKYNINNIEIPEESGEKDLTDYYTKFDKEKTSSMLKDILNEKKEEN